MAEGDIQPISLGGGGGGLTPPVISYGSIDLKPLYTALQQRALNQHRAQQVQLDLQKMAQDANLKEEAFKLEREKMHADDDLRAAQMENYYAMADYHRAAAKQEATGMRTKWQYEAGLVPELSNFRTEADGLSKQYDVGTQEYANAFNALKLKYEPVLATEPGRRALSAYGTLFNRQASSIAQGQKTAAAQLASNTRTYDIPMEAFDQLESDVAKKRQNNIWGVNKDEEGNIESRFAYFPIDDPKGQAVPLKEVNAKGFNKAAHRAITIPQERVDSILDLKKKIDPIQRTGKGMAPAEYYQQPQGQTQPTRRYKYDPSTPTGIVPLDLPAASDAGGTPYDERGPDFSPDTQQ